jgi:hypothetical protein
MMWGQLQIKSLGAGGALGVLLGIGLVSWIEPDTPGGTGLIIVVSVLVTSVVFATARALFSTRDNERRNESKSQ